VLKRRSAQTLLNPNPCFTQREWLTERLEAPPFQSKDKIGGF